MRYELGRGGDVIATGHFSSGRPIEAGERVAIAGREGIVPSIEPLLGELEQRLIVQLVRDRRRAARRWDGYW